MSLRDRSVRRSLVVSVLFAAVCGSLGGLVSGWMLFLQMVEPELARLSEAVEGISVSGTKSVVRPPMAEPPVQVIPVESRPLAPSFPAAFSERRTSAVITLVRRARVASVEPVPIERELGAAVAITSDGWLATTEEAMQGLRLADVGAIVNGNVVAVERGIRDKSTGIIYLKITATGLPTQAFVRASDVVSGAAVWIESVPKHLAPEIVVSSRARLELVPVSSERAMRRFLVSGDAKRYRSGAPVWDGAGRLVGLLESSEIGGWRVIPAGPIGNGLTQILSQNEEIRRASLGVRAFDLSDIALDIATSTLPDLGAWLRSDRKAGLPAVAPRGPSAGVLQDGDVIERIERDILDGTADLGERLFDYRPGASVGISGRRKGVAFQAQVTLGLEIVSEKLK